MLFLIQMTAASGLEQRRVMRGDLFSDITTSLNVKSYTFSFQIGIVAKLIHHYLYVNLFPEHVRIKKKKRHTRF